MNHLTAAARTLAFTGFAAALAACFGTAPPRPAPIELPALVDGEDVVVEVEETTELEDVPKKSVTCPQGHVEGSPACTITRWTEREPVRHVTTTATYAGAPISYPQLHVLTDAERDAKLARLEHLSTQCKRAGTARKIGIALATVGVVGIFTIQYLGTPGAIGTTGLLAGSATSFGIGYWGYGGKRCGEAQELHRELTFATGVPWGDDAYAAAMKEMADRFNAGTTRAAQRE